MAESYEDGDQHRPMSLVAQEGLYAFTRESSYCF